MTSIFYSILLLISQALRPALAVTHALAQPVEQQRARTSALVGQVVNETGNSLPGVVVVVQGSHSMASTNADGRFMVNAPVLDPVLVFSCAGYRVQTVVPPAEGPIAVTMYSLAGHGSDGSTSRPGGGTLGGSEVRPAAQAFADVMPVFTGGEKAYSDYLLKNAQYPAEALEKSLEGMVYVSFVVDEQGRVCDAEVAKGCGHGFDEEALRLVRLMPWWQPGQLAGQPARVAITLRIRFAARQP